MRVITSIQLKPCENPECPYKHTERTVDMDKVQCCHAGQGVILLGTFVCMCGYHLSPVYIYTPET